MALTKVKTWTKDMAVVLTGEGPTPQLSANAGHTTNRQLMFELKEILIGANGNWTVARSCGYDGGSWTNGAADYWTVANDVRWRESGGEFTWIVFQNNAIATGFQMMFVLDDEDTNTYNFNNVYFSHSGSFTGGTATTRPTASDEYYLEMTTAGLFSSESNDKRVNVLMSTDGECTRIIFSANHAWLGCIHAELPKTSTGMGADYFESRALTALLRYSTYNLTSDTDYKGKLVRAGGAICPWVCVSEGLANKPCADSVHMQGVDYSGNRNATPFYAFIVRGLIRGCLGEMVDIYNVDSALSDGDSAPFGGSADWVVIDDYLYASDGTAFTL